MDAGETFLIPTLDDHLWMVISDPRLDPELVVVCFLSWQSWHDQACIVRAGEHPFVQHDTCVNYPGARVVPESRLDSQKAAGVLKSKAPLSPELLARIRTSAEDSQIPNDCYGVLRQQGFVP